MFDNYDADNKVRVEVVYVMLLLLKIKKMCTIDCLPEDYYYQWRYLWYIVNKSVRPPLKLLAFQATLGAFF